jgi:hypothetical protein
MKRLLLIAAIIATTSASTNAAQPRKQAPKRPAPVRQVVCTEPFSYADSPTYPVYHGPSPFRWGYFGAEYQPPAAVMYRDFAYGHREFQYRR